MRLGAAWEYERPWCFWMNKSRHASKSTKSKDTPPGARKTAGSRLPLFLARSILVLAAFSLSVPLLVSNSFYYPQVFLKSILFRITVQVMALLYVILTVQSPFYRPRFHRIICALLAYFGLMLISSLPWISVDAWSSWWGDFSWMGGLFSQLHLLTYFFVLAQTLKRERDWVALFCAALFSGVLMGFSGLVQFLKLDYLYLFNPGERIRERRATRSSLPPACCSAFSSSFGLSDEGTEERFILSWQNAGWPFWPHWMHR